ncbi:MAG: MurR/RpiR family transcriptional regulator [Blautia sp.]|uniref:MurR/RpiR family transcriptional regulator n=1 Tax=Blautia sp. TaxID=1955243 RepID=UPI002421C415|nr:MurR/RpiR family transcriptional regulator [Blautia sp.]MBS6160748.1 MurR/RpiR family transcriptional regulator [Bacillota bacterium]MEE1443157.1 MurR/RpiR family transcriptional regulator [Blautia sp.]
MFSYDELQKYNETDIRIYKYMVSNLEKIQYMTIRELAEELQVSTSTILRFCNKNDFVGYAEFKEALKKEILLQKSTPPSEDLQELSDFFERTNSNAFEEKLSAAVQMLRNSDMIIFIGMGSSGTLAKYGARYFSNLGHFAVGLEDALYPIEFFQWKNTAVLAISESGETSRLMEAIHQFKQKNCKILSITNSSLSTLAKLSDWNFSYHLKPQRINGGYNGTTQVPALFVMEALAKRI